MFHYVSIIISIDPYRFIISIDVERIFFILGIINHGGENFTIPNLENYVMIQPNKSYYR